MQHETHQSKDAQDARRAGDVDSMNKQDAAVAEKVENIVAVEGEPLPAQADPKLEGHDIASGVQATPSGQFATAPIVAPPRRRFQVLRTFLGSPKSRLGFGIVFFFILVAILAPWIAPASPTQFTGVIGSPPSPEHWFGTGTQGRDVFSQTVWGARITLVVGFATGALASTLAVIVGLTAAFFRGRVDDIITLIANLFLTIPGLPLLIVISVYFQAGTLTVVLALAFTSWAYGSRIIRAQALSIREKEFIAASIVAGESNSRIIFREMLPNLINIIVGNFLGNSLFAIAASTSLAFLGLTDTTEISWGTNLFFAQNGGALMRGYWWTFVPSGLCVAFVAFGLSMINYGMDEITNPRLRAERELRNVLVKNKAFKRTRSTPVVNRSN
jgi:peptide/nickel transport system permease protein